jgi:hypothetical protein
LQIGKVGKQRPHGIKPGIVGAVYRLRPELRAGPCEPDGGRLAFGGLGRFNQALENLFFKSERSEAGSSRRCGMPGINETSKLQHASATGRASRRVSAPILRTVPDVQDFDNFFRGTIDDDIRRADEFAGSFHLSGSAKAGKSRQLFNAVDKRLCDIRGGGGIVLLDVFNSGFKLVSGFGRPPNLPHE